MKEALIVSILTLFSYYIFAQGEGKTLPPWQDGEMEIHHINTGRGEAVFCILPDGTTLLIDAGYTGSHNNPRATIPLPNGSKQAGEWIARYISKRMDFKIKKKIDYALLTHFHGDHMGSAFKYSPKTSKGGNYYLTGLTEVYEYVPFSKMVDRDWPSYQYPVPQTGKGFKNYKNFIDWNIKYDDMQMERFIPGTNSQFVLLNNPEKYKGIFEVRNIVSNGELWTGEGQKSQKLFPEGESINENICSTGIRITYGNFDYFNGGDLSGRLPLGSESWRDIESPVGKIVGPIEVCEANHHASADAMNEGFLTSVKPQIIVIQVFWNVHLNQSVIQSMANNRLNPNLKHIIPTNIPALSRAYLGSGHINKLTGDGGHAVIVVEKGGKKYRVFLLNETDESFRIKSEYGPFECME